MSINAIEVEGRRNPYVDEPQLRGRDAVLELLDRLVNDVRAGVNSPGIVLQGNRGAGVTSLLRAFADGAERSGLTVSGFVVTPGREIAPDLIAWFERVFRSLEPSDDEVAQARAGLSSLSTITINGDGPRLTLTVDDKAAAVMSRLARDLVKLFTVLHELAVQRGSGLALVIDEIHRADDVGFRAVLTAMERLQALDISIAMVLGGLPTTPRLPPRARARLDEIVTTVAVTALDPSIAATVLTAPAAGLGVDYEPTALSAAVAWADGNAWCLQLLGRHTWNFLQDDTVTADAVAAGIRAAQRSIDAIAARELRAASDKEIHFLRVMTEFGSGPYTSDHLRLAEDKYGLAPDLLTPALALVRLLTKGIIVTDHEYTSVEFVMPKLADYLAATAP
ncbi:ATP-binding protein [Antrihabitans sp. YC3-6]|uniref:ATP-binding protein n=1 Tax=Antrihabitans stalagmiti TaxID=2799499 RepID=A0A934U606_9NOCA|nr:ATP-binding protein [Antrihabitans stalagmiti]MBJ8342074.1 ATP-binding protein [Antrihabitans stalagmiti]